MLNVSIDKMQYNAICNIFHLFLGLELDPRIILESSAGIPVIFWILKPGVPILTAFIQLFDVILLALHQRLEFILVFQDLECETGRGMPRDMAVNCPSARIVSPKGDHYKAILWKQDNIATGWVVIC